MGKTYPITEKLCIDIRAYLIGRPWGEVNHLIVGLSQQVIAAEEEIAKQQEIIEQQRQERMAKIVEERAEERNPKKNGKPAEQ